MKQHKTELLDLRCMDCMDGLRQMEAESVNCCVTSPPYFGLRSYTDNDPNEIGKEETPDAFVAKLVGVFREVKRVLRDDGTLWLNLGDSYGGGNGGASASKKQTSNRGTSNAWKGCGMPKQLLGIPWRVAFALQADGWYLRQDIIWHKPNPMPESVRDRCTKAHEYIFLLTKSARYWYDSEAVKEAAKFGEHHAKYSGTYKRHKVEAMQTQGATNGENYQRGMQQAMKDPLNRNRRSVWTVATRPYKGAHFATFPPDLIEPCILAGSRERDIVLDPFIGSGTTAAVAIQHGRQYIGCELNKEYRALQNERIASANLQAQQIDWVEEA